MYCIKNILSYVFTLLQTFKGNLKRVKVTVIRCNGTRKTQVKTFGRHQKPADASSEPVQTSPGADIPVVINHVDVQQDNIQGIISEVTL